MHTEAAKFPVVILKFNERAWGQRHYEIKPNTENVSIWNYFGVGLNNKCNEMTMLPVSLQYFDCALNYHFNVLVFCGASNQYSQITVISSKI